MGQPGNGHYPARAAVPMVSRPEGAEERLTLSQQSFLTLDDISVSLFRLLEYEAWRTPKGEAPSQPFLANTTLDEGVDCEPPWFSANILHDGAAGILYVRVNDSNARPIEVNVGETLKLEYGAPVIKTIFLTASVGTIAGRIFGTR